jgi:hypothetical protein
MMLSATANYIYVRLSAEKVWLNHLELCAHVCTRVHSQIWNSIFTKSSDIHSIPHLKVLLRTHVMPDFPISEVIHPSKEILQIV